MNTIIELLNSSTVLTTVVGLLVVAFAKSIVKIFQMGVYFKAELASKQELRDFENEMRRDMRSYCIQIQKTVTEAAMTIINNKLKDIEDSRNVAIEMRVLKAELDAELKNVIERSEEVRASADTLRTLANKVSHLEYEIEISKGQKMMSVERRTTNPMK